MSGDHNERVGEGSQEVEEAVRYHLDDDGIVTLTLDDPTSSANTMTDRYQASMEAAVARLYADHEAAPDTIVGVVVASAKRTFFAGGNLKEMTLAGPDQAGEIFAQVERIKATLRRLETFPRQVVAAINGAALGGGFEIALACQHRVLVADPRVQVGLPESTLGLLPGGGGVTRVTRMLGLSTALMEVLLPGTRMRPEQALAAGLVDELVGSLDELIPAARAWLFAHRDDAEAAQQPWDRPGYRMPGGTPSSKALAAALPAFPALLRKQSKGAVYPAQRAILAVAVEGAATDFETASRIESRHLTKLICGQGSKNMIQAFFTDLQAIGSGALRPADQPRRQAQRVGILGAGMMGAGIAYSCARAGMEVVLKDVNLAAAERGCDYSAKVLDKAIARGSSTQESKAEHLARIHPTAEMADLAGCDLIIEAVFEDPALKAQVYAEVAPYLDADTLLCSNTSTLPITELAETVARPEEFIGLHFFSPVDKMPLVEIIVGRRTSPAALARAYDVVQQIKKTPIVVNDSRGFYTSRVIGTRVNEGMAILAEGMAPASLERAATQAGYPVGTLQLADELNLELLAKIGRANRTAGETAGVAWVEHPGERVVSAMLEAGRPGRLGGAGFYDYDEATSRRVGLWPGLGELFDRAQVQLPLADMADRLLFIEALETVKCFAEGVITSTAAANIGSIMGIGFPPMTGGAAQFVTGYIGADGSVGIEAFLRRADELAAAYGERFAPPPALRALGESGASLESLVP